MASQRSLRGLDWFVELRPRHRCQIGGNERSPRRLNIGDEKRKPIEAAKAALRRHGSAELRLVLSFLPARVRFWERTLLPHRKTSVNDPKQTLGLIGVRRWPQYSSIKGSNDYLAKSLDRNTIGRSAWVCPSENLRDARSSITSRSRIN